MFHNDGKYPAGVGGGDARGYVSLAIAISLGRYMVKNVGHRAYLTTKLELLFLF